MTWFNDVWSYDPRTNSWTQLECIGYIPAAREGHAAALVGDVMYVFGGRTEEGNDLGDLAAFRISSRRWYTFQNMGPSPSPRSGHSMTAFGKHIVVLGGEPSSTPRDPGELSIAYYLDTSKIRYPADSQSQAPVEQRIQGHRRPSGGERSGIPQGRGIPPVRDPNDHAVDTARRAVTSPVHRVNDSTGGNSRLPRAAGIPTPAGPGAQLPRSNGPQSRQPTRPERPERPDRPDRAISPGADGPSIPPMSHLIIPASSVDPAPRETNGRVTSPTFSNDQSFFDSEDAPQSPFSQQPLFKPQQPQQPQQPYQPVPAQSFPANNVHEEQQDPREPSRSLSKARPPPQLVERSEETPRASLDHGGSLNQATSIARAAEPRQDLERQLPIDSGLGSSPALSQLTDTLAKELETERSKNAWYASELALARKAGYSRDTSASPALDERSPEAFQEEDRPLVEALLKMRAELAKVQGSIESQSTAAATKIAEIEKQRDAAISEAVFAKAKLAAQGGNSPMLESSREGTAGTDRAIDLNRRLASSLAAQTELSRKLESLTHEKEAEKSARLVAEETAEAAQKRVAELETDRQQHASEFESLRAELHEAQKSAREAAANHSEISTAHKLLLVDHRELNDRHRDIEDQSKGHGSMLLSLREALAASTEKATLLEQKLDEERALRDEHEEKLTQLRSEHEDRTRELEHTTRRLRDVEEIAEKHAAEARTHRQAVLDGLDSYASRTIDNSSIVEERVTILQEQIEAANAMVRQNQAAADSASEKLRRAEERIAGLEAYQEQASREGLSMRKQLQTALKDAKTANEEKAELQQQLQSQQLETNAIAVQHGALKNLLGERGINPSDVRRSRAIDSPSSQIRLGTPDIQRVKELEAQLEASLRSHDDIKTHLDEMHAREGLTRKEYDEKLAALDNDHQAAVKYLRGTEKMLSKMKQELQRVKSQAADYQKELEGVRSKDGQAAQFAANWEQERDSLRKDLESTKADLEAKVTSLQRDVNTREADLEQLRASHNSTRTNLVALQSTHQESQADLERLRRDNTALEQRARDAENKVQLLLNQVESSVDNYRRQSVQPRGLNGSAHRRGASDVSVSTPSMLNAPSGLSSHRRGESLGNDSIYSQSIAPSEAEGTVTQEGPDERNSLALDSLASELDALRSHWETTNKSYNRLSDRYDYDKTPTAGTAPAEFGSSGSGGGVGGLMTNWRIGLKDDEDESRPSTSDSDTTKKLHESPLRGHY